MNRKGNSRFWGKKRTENKRRNNQRERGSFHRRNLDLAAAPLLFILTIIRTIAFQLWVVLGLLICRSRSVLSARCKQGVENESRSDAEIGMSRLNKTTAGPGAPALASQKHHHRKAFEYISKALKIDEEDSGKSP